MIMLIYPVSDWLAPSPLIYFSLKQHLMQHSVATWKTWRENTIDLIFKLMSFFHSPPNRPLECLSSSWDHQALLLAATLSIDFLFYETKSSDNWAPSRNMCHLKCIFTHLTQIYVLQLKYISKWPITPFAMSQPRSASLINHVNDTCPVWRSNQRQQDLSSLCV